VSAVDPHLECVCVCEYVMLLFHLFLLLSIRLSAKKCFRIEGLQPQRVAAAVASSRNILGFSLAEFFKSLEVGGERVWLE
jgi:hypothetical protein